MTDDMTPTSTGGDDERSDDAETALPATITRVPAEGGTAVLNAGIVGRGAAGVPAIERLGDYRIVREIGRGGMGVVYEAEQESLGRRVAVKVLLKQMLIDDTHVERFKREAKVAAGLHHTNIVQVYGVGEDAGFHYYVMQLIDGVALDGVLAHLGKTVRGETFRRHVFSAGDGPGTERLCWQLLNTETRHDAASAIRTSLMGAVRDGGAVANQSQTTAPAATESAGRQQLGTRYWHNVAGLALQVADALDYAHEQGALHRDVKPANLLIDDHGIVWLTDFGLAKSAQSVDLTLTGQIGGTPPYMAPEQFDGVTDRRSEIYSLGVTLYEMLALRPAFDEKDQTRLIRRIIDGDIRPLRKVDPRTPRDLETIVAKATAREQRHRYATAGQMAEDLQRYLDGRPILARKITTVERMWRWSRRNPAVAVLSAAAIVLLVVAGAVGWVGYVNTTEALERESAQLSKTEAEQSRAEANLGLAIQAFDEVFREVALGDLATTGTSDGDMEDTAMLPAISTRDIHILQNLLTFYVRFAVENRDNPVLQLETAKAHHRMGAIHNRLGQFEMAVQACRTALDIREGFAETATDSEPHLRAVADLCNELGFALQMTGAFNEGQGCYRKALDVLSELVADSPGDASLKLSMIRTYHKLGMGPELASSRGVGAGGRSGGGLGRDSSAKALELARELVAQEPNKPEYRHALALTYRNLALISNRRRDSQGARDWTEKCISELSALADEFPRVPGYRYDLAMVCSTGPVAGARRMEDAVAGILQEWSERYALALSLTSELSTEYPDVPAYRAALGRAHMRLGELELSGSHVSEARSHQESAVELLSCLAAEHPSVRPYRYEYLRAAQILARTCCADRDLDRSRSVLSDLIQVLTDETTDTPVSGRDLMLRVRVYEELADVLDRSGDSEGAEAARTKATEMRRQAGSPGEGQPGGREWSGARGGRGELREEGRGVGRGGNGRGQGRW